jgi:glucose-1-phosphate thymidylyltransferase
MTFSYAEQPKPEGLAQAFVIGRPFIAGAPVCLVLGDNIFYGQGLTGTLQGAASIRQGGHIFAYCVRDPERYGVVEFDASGKVLGIEEKPKIPKSRFAVPGLYYYGPEVCDLAARLKPSARGELEITDLNGILLQQGKLSVLRLGRGTAWLDTGTHRNLQDASDFVAAIEERQGLKVACIEEIAWNNGWIGPREVRAEAESMGKSNYAAYLLDLLAQKGG